MSNLSKSSKNGHGGARIGAGRPSVGTKGVTLRLTQLQHQRLMALGGSSWVVKRLKELDVDKKEVTLRLTQPQHQRLLVLGGSSWIVKRLEELDDRLVIVFHERAKDRYTMRIMTGCQLSQMLERNGPDAFSKTTAFSDTDGAKLFIESKRSRLGAVADYWLDMIDSAYYTQK